MDVIITDIRMPGMSGLDLIQRLRDGSGGEVPIIILSGYADFHYAQRAIELGVAKYMTKPTNPRELLAFLSQLEGRLETGRTVSEAPRQEGGEVANLLVARAIDYLEAHYQEKISLREVAAALYISPNYLSELFRRHTGQTLSDYLQRLRMDFPLPCPSGEGLPLTVEALAALMAEKRPAVFYSADLCARYFTCLREGESHFILFDDAHTISRKIQAGNALGIPTGFLLYPEAEDLLPQLFTRQGSGVPQRG